MTLDWDFIGRFIPAFIKGLELTLSISLFGILLALVVGFLSAVILYFKPRFLTSLTHAYVEVARNTPLLIQLFFLYYGLNEIGLRLSAFSCAIIALGFLGGGYMAQSFLLGFKSLNPIQTQSALSLGFSRLQLMRYIILPQSLSVSMPSLTANVIFLLKETSVVGAIALTDIMFVAKDLIGIYYKTTESLLMLTLSYLVILLPLSVFASFLENHFKKKLV
ncbi:amino acid ABC transporter permease [Helicobacter cetorum]|uniref:amino acid ABC transporter permease n=1 Tax=Helicobacter cetorum TaxID=138563 RepID=UPI000CF14DFA|nr:amino acid ABC transporter permease [Helicobacter cetorum]